MTTSSIDQAPEKTQTAMSQTLACMDDRLQQTPAGDAAYVFLVRGLVDGTVKTTNMSEGPLADAGRVQMISTLSANTNPAYAAVLDHFPTLFSSVGNETVGLNRYGVPSDDNMEQFQPMMTRLINRHRQANGDPLVSSTIPLVIDGAFTRLDDSPTASKGDGHNGGYRGDQDEEKSTAFDFGGSSSSRSMTLVVNIIDPRFNTIVGTEAFNLTFYNQSKRARFRIAINDVYYGFSNSDVVVDSVHGAQQALLDAAAVWILDNAFGEHADFASCFQSEQMLALGTDKRTNEAEQQLADSEALLNDDEEASMPVLDIEAHQPTLEVSKVDNHQFDDELHAIGG